MIALLSVLGLVIGSFLGTLVMRLPEGRPVLFARSCCDHCGKILSPWQLVPLLGFSVQRGRCINCGGRISLLHPAIEIAAAALAVWALVVVAGPALWFTLALGWLLLALAVMDLRSFRLSDALVVPLMAAGLATAWFVDRGHFSGHLAGVLAGWTSLFLVGHAYRLLRKREGLGAGDAKLLGAIGAWTRWDGLPSVVLVASALALAVIAARSLSGHPLKADSKLAFGAYLCAAAWIVWLYGPLWG